MQQAIRTERHAFTSKSLTVQIYAALFERAAGLTPALEQRLAIATAPSPSSSPRNRVDHVLRVELFAVADVERGNLALELNQGLGG